MELMLRYNIQICMLYHEIDPAHLDLDSKRFNGCLTEYGTTSIRDNRPWFLQTHFLS